jgi:PAS domain S-box-containing protein
MEPPIQDAPDQGRGPEPQAPPAPPDPSAPALSPSLLLQTLDAIGEGIIVRGTDGMLVWANAEAARQLGMSVEELLAHPPDRVAQRYDVFDAEGRPMATEGFPGRGALAGDPGSPPRETVVRYLERSTGAERWANVRAEELRDREGRLLGSVTVFRDITIQQRALSERDQSEQRLAFLASAGPELLATSLDSGGVLQLLADLIVPALATTCSVREVLPDGSVRRIAMRHADPAKAEVLRRLEAYPPWTQALIAESMQAGRPFLAAEIRSEMLSELAADATHLGLLEAIGPRSLIGVPVMSKGRTVGVITAVRDESGPPYEEADVVLLSDLARRAGLAIENALLYEEERSARTLAEQTRAEIAFLLDASTLLGSSLDFEAGLLRLARLAAATLCDLCLIDLIDPADGSITRVAAEATDPAQQPLADQLRERFAPLPSGDHPAARVMRTGVAEFAAEMPEEFLRATTRDDEHRALTSELALRSYVSVPLAARNKILGSLTLIATSTSGRRYTEEDVALASDLARRAALALDNARLYQQTEFQTALLTSQSDATIEGALVVSADGVIVSHNRRLLEMWAVPDAIVERRDANALLEWVSAMVVDPGEFRARAFELREEYAVSARDQIRLLDGRVFDRWTSPLTGRAGENYGRAWYFRDVTDLKQAQEERSRLYDAERVARLEVETSRARLQFLLEASTVLAGALDINAALAALADRLVQTLADRCLIDLAANNGPALRIAAGPADPGPADPGPDSGPDSGPGSGPDSGPDSGPADIGGAGHDPLSPRDGAPARVMSTRVPLLLPPAPAPSPDADAPDAETARAQGSMAFPDSSVVSYLGVPLVSRGRVLGCLSLVTDAGGLRRFGPDDLVLAQDLARRISLALDHARLFESQRHIAMTLQKSLLPPELPTIPGMELAARYRPAIEASEVGGDFYDVFPMEDGGWACAIGDISGKGVEAAALTSLARYTLRTAAREHPEPTVILNLLNDAVLAESPVARFLTVAFGRLEPDGEGRVRLTVSCGGHPLPLLLRAGGTVEQAGRPGTLIGFLPDPQLSEMVNDLAAGDAVVFYTDGLTDVRGPSGTFGERRLTEVLGRCRGFPAEAIAARLEAEVLAFLEGEPRDDLAVLVLRVLPGAEPG